jgi:hypothetical protein
VIILMVDSTETEGPEGPHNVRAVAYKSNSSSPQFPSALNREHRREGAEFLLGPRYARAFGAPLRGVGLDWWARPSNPTAISPSVHSRLPLLRRHHHLHPRFVVSCANAKKNRVAASSSVRAVDAVRR